MGTFIDITGQKFGRLTAIKYAGNRKWLCVCSCGVEKIIEGSSLRGGITKSCGCYNSDRTIERNTKHSLCYTKLYTTYKGIKERCFNPNCKPYKNYGGRGITMFNDWIHNPKLFCDYVSKLPHCGENGRTIDRINNNGNYEPGNLRWATRKEQRLNSRQK